MDGGVLDLADYEAQDDIHAVAGALKQYLRELPEPLLTHKLHDEWLKAAGYVFLLSCEIAVYLLVYY